jgi:intracellular septation protein
MKALLDYLPLIIFFYFYKTTDPKDHQHPLLQLVGSHGNADQNNILVATSALLIATLIVYGCLFLFQRFKLEKQQWFIVASTVVFGGLTLCFSDVDYIKYKAILLNLGFGLAFLVSPYFGKDKIPLIQRMFSAFMELSRAGWQRLNYAWVGLFVLMAALHTFFAFIFMQGKYWGEFTAFGDMIVMFSFIIIQLFILRKHFKAPDK